MWQGRFIPAHAGNTYSVGLPAPWLSVHPRACGEHDRPLLRRHDPGGSSPRMRGTQYAQQAEKLCKRFIPAHAGNTAEPLVRLLSLAVHPRACGEHLTNCSTLICKSGSSPRMRGTPCCSIPIAIISRFIPAHAGNTGSDRPIHDRRAVHPRACGEHGGTGWPELSTGGSSPRMRGTRLAFLVNVSRRRFIPAHAGNTIEMTF